MKTKPDFSNFYQQREQRLASAKFFIDALPKYVFERNRHTQAVEERRKAIIQLKDTFNLSFPEIGKVIGGRDHTSIIHLYYKNNE